MTVSALEQRIDRVRRFNRFYTQKIGVLGEGLLGSPFSLTEARVLYELAQCESSTAAARLARDLALDAGYLSRILRRFDRIGLIDRAPAPNDARQSLLSLSSAGRAAFAPLDRKSREEIDELLSPLADPRQQRLCAAMATIEAILAPSPPASPPYLLRPHRPGDMGWVTYRHGILYAEEYAWDERFEGLVAGIVAHFIEHFDARRERCWIAEREGESVGSVFLVRETETVAKLRLLLVEPTARGLGIGRRLVDECIRFARQSGYASITLWTNSILVAARAVYRATGFELIEAQPHHSFGHDLVGENWRLDL